MALFLDVLLNHRVCYCASGRAEIPNCPEVLAPELLVELRVFHLQLPGALALEMLNDSRYCNVWRNFQKKVHMVWADSSLEDINFVRATNLTNNLSQPITDFVLKNLLTVFSDPDNMELVVVDRVTCTFIPRH